MAPRGAVGRHELIGVSSQVYEERASRVTGIYWSLRKAPAGSRPEAASRGKGQRPAMGRQQGLHLDQGAVTSGGVLLVWDRIKVIPQARRRARVAGAHGRARARWSQRCGWVLKTRSTEQGGSTQSTDPAEPLHVEQTVFPGSQSPLLAVKPRSLATPTARVSPVPSQRGSAMGQPSLPQFPASTSPTIPRRPHYPPPAPPAIPKSLDPFSVSISLTCFLLSALLPTQMRDPPPNSANHPLD